MRALLSSQDRFAAQRSAFASSPSHRVYRDEQPPGPSRMSGRIRGMLECANSTAVPHRRRCAPAGPSPVGSTTLPEPCGSSVGSSGTSATTPTCSAGTRSTSEPLGVCEESKRYVPGLLDQVDDEGLDLAFGGVSEGWGSAGSRRSHPRSHCVENTISPQARNCLRDLDGPVSTFLSSS